VTYPTWSLAAEAAAAPVLDEWAAVYALPKDVVYGLVALESGFQPGAIRQEPQIQDASYGLTQILLGTARGLGYTGDAQGLFDPETNVQYGLLYLRQMLDRFGDLSLALSAYNGGYRGGQVTNPTYVEGVLDRAAWFAEQWGWTSTTHEAPSADAGGPSLTAGIPWWAAVAAGAVTWWAVSR
jgi:soluble lytic murein transglycosylase-like protein